MRQQAKPRPQRGAKALTEIPKDVVFKSVSACKRYDWKTLAGRRFSVIYAQAGASRQAIQNATLEKVERTKAGDAGWLRIVGEVDSGQFPRRRRVRIHCTWVKQVYSEKRWLTQLLEEYVKE